MIQTTTQNGGPVPLVKDQNSESESLFWEVADPAKAEAQPTRQERTEKIITIDGDFYKRVGFYSAFNKSAEDEFRQEIQKLRTAVEQKIQHLTNELKGDLERFNDGKDDADTKISNIKTSLVQYEQQVDELKNELVPLKERLQVLNKEIRSTLGEIGKKKETLIKDRQDALLEELNRLNSELEGVVRKRMNLNEEVFAKQKEALQEKRAFLVRLFEKYEKEHDELMEKLSLYSLQGFQSFSSTFLYNAGLISATVAGGFFGSFAEANFLASGGAFSFVVQSLFNFSTTFLGQSANAPSFTARMGYAGLLLAIFLGLLILMFGVSWLCEWAYGKLLLSRSADKPPKDSAPADADRKEVSFGFNFDGGDEFPVQAKIAERNFFGFWLRILPFLLFLSIVFILVSLGTDPSTMRSVDASVAGYGIGFLIALACGGIAYVYLTMFLERRIQQQLAKQKEYEISWPRLNLELLGVIAAFIAIVMITLLAFRYPFKTGSNTLSLVSFLFFAAGCLITAFTLGFGIRLQSLEAARLQLERECDITQTRLIRISRPFQIYLTPRENIHFNRKFIQIRDEIMSLMLERTTLTRRAAVTPLVKPTQSTRFFSNLNRWFRKKLPWRTTEPTPQPEPAQGQTPAEEPPLLSASEDVKLCFPKLDAELTSLESEAGEVRSRIDFVEKEIRCRTEQKGEFYEKKTTELRQQETRSRNYHKAITNRQKRFHHDIDEEHWRENFYIQKIVEGYELGEWFTKHRLANREIPDFAWNGNGHHDTNGVTLD